MNNLDSHRQALENSINRLVLAVISGVKPKFIDMYLNKYEIAHNRFIQALS